MFLVTNSHYLHIQTLEPCSHIHRFRLQSLTFRCDTKDLWLMDELHQIFHTSCCFSLINSAVFTGMVINAEFLLWSVKLFQYESYITVLCPKLTQVPNAKLQSISHDLFEPCTYPDEKSNRSTDLPSHSASNNSATTCLSSLSITLLVLQTLGPKNWIGTFKHTMHPHENRIHHQGGLCPLTHSLTPQPRP